jgi:nucleotide-binding universal stress UspA family protein
MLAVDTILVARDASPASRRALRTGLLLAAQMEATLCVLHVFDNRKSVHPTQGLDAVRRELVEAGLTSDRKLKSLSIRSAEREGANPTATILRYAAEIGADLMVLGTHGRSGMKRVFTGSVAETVIRRASRAVLTVRDRSEDLVAFGGIDRILVPIDFSEFALESTRVAMEWGELYGAHADLLHVDDGNRRQSTTEAPSGETDVQDHDAASSGSSPVAEGRSRLVELAKAGRRFDVPTNLHVMHGDVGDAIIDFAATHETDLVVMATHGRTGMKRVVLGSVTETVLRHVSCPVLTVRATGQSIRATALD